MTDDSVATRVTRAEMLLKVRRYDEAVAEAGKALAQSPDNFAAQSVLARALFGAGRPLDALREAERAIALRPESANAQCVVAQAALELSRLQRAERATAEAFVAAEPYFRAGIFESVVISRWRCAIPESTPGGLRSERDRARAAAAANHA